MIRRAFDEAGDYAINTFIEDSEATMQAITTRLRLFKGEWFLNLSSGIPWFQDIFTKPARLTEVERIIRTAIVQTEGVNKLLQFNLNFDSSTRELNVAFSYDSIYGDGLEFSDVIGLNPVVV